MMWDYGVLEGNLGQSGARVSIIRGGGELSVLECGKRSRLGSDRHCALRPWRYLSTQQRKLGETGIPRGKISMPQSNGAGSA